MARASSVEDVAEVERARIQAAADAKDAVIATERADKAARVALALKQQQDLEAALVTDAQRRADGAWATKLETVMRKIELEPALIEAALATPAEREAHRVAIGCSLTAMEIAASCGGVRYWWLREFPLRENPPAAFLAVCCAVFILHNRQFGTDNSATRRKMEG